MKRLTAQLLTILLILTFSSQFAYASTNQQPSVWALESIVAAEKLGLVPDEIGSDFQSPTTRGDFCKLAIGLIEAYYAKPIAEILTERHLMLTTFVDTDDPAVGAAAALGIVLSSEWGEVRPATPLTREQVAPLLVNTLSALNITITGWNSVDWQDANDIAQFYRPAIDMLYHAKILDSTSAEALVFAPQMPYTREQAIATSLNVWNYIVSQRTSELLVLPGFLIPEPPQVATTPAPTPTVPVAPARQYDPNDYNVKMRPQWASARTAEDIRNSEGPEFWDSAQEIIDTLIEQSKDPANWIDGVSNYDYRVGKIQAWVDRYLLENGLTYKDKTDYEKTEIIHQVIMDGRLEEFIGLWQPGFTYAEYDKVHGGSCVPRAEAVYFLMIALDFELFTKVGGVITKGHMWNAYWDSTVGAVRFLDESYSHYWTAATQSYRFEPETGVWNIFLDQLYARNVKIDPM